MNRAGLERPLINRSLKYFKNYQFKKRAFTMWIIDMPQDKSKWFNGNCNCPHFLKSFTYQHVVGIALGLEYFKAPPEAKTVPLGKKRKPERPS